MRMMFTGVGRLLSNFQEVMELCSQLKTSGNWAKMNKSLRKWYAEKTEDNTIMWEMMGIYGRVSELYQEG